jgi:hypothetical protein
MIVDPPQQGRNACGGATNLIESHHAPAIVYCASGRLLLRAATGNRGSVRLQRLAALRLNRKPTFCPKCLPLTLVARAEPDELTTVRYPPQAAVADAGGMQKTTLWRTSVDRSPLQEFRDFAAHQLVHLSTTYKATRPQFLPNRTFGSGATGTP